MTVVFKARPTPPGFVRILMLTNLTAATPTRTTTTTAVMAMSLFAEP